MSICYTAIKIQHLGFMGRPKPRDVEPPPLLRAVRRDWPELAVTERVGTDGSKTSKTVPGVASDCLAADDLQRLRSGDRTAFRRIYDAYAGLLLYVVRRHGLSDEEADEVMQETFLKLHQRANDVRDPARLKAWLVSLARNLAVDRLRSKKRQAQSTSQDVLEEAHIPLWQNDDSAAREAELLLVKELVERLARAPGGETFRLFYVEGHSAKKIAAENGEAISTVTTRLSRLRDRFRTELREHIETLRNQTARP